MLQRHFLLSFFNFFFILIFVSGQGGMSKTPSSIKLSLNLFFKLLYLLFLDKLKMFISLGVIIRTNLDETLNISFTSFSSFIFSIAQKFHTISKLLSLKG